jgi:hypothetical protein
MQVAVTANTPRAKYQACQLRCLSEGSFHGSFTNVPSDYFTHPQPKPFRTTLKHVTFMS